MVDGDYNNYCNICYFKRPERKKTIMKMITTERLQVKTCYIYSGKLGMRPSMEKGFLSVDFYDLNKSGNSLSC